MVLPSGGIANAAPLSRVPHLQCNLGPRAKDNDCAFLIDHSTYPEAASVPTIPATYTYCSDEKKCIPPPVRR